jgi:hypothetical protein
LSIAFLVGRKAEPQASSRRIGVRSAGARAAVIASAEGPRLPFGTFQVIAKLAEPVGLKSEQVKRLKDLELENSRLRRAVSDLTLDKLILQEAARGNF